MKTAALLVCIKNYRLALTCVTCLAFAPVCAQEIQWQEMHEALTPHLISAQQENVRLTIAILDLSTAPNAARRVAVLGSPQTYPPASTIKMLLLATLMQQVDAGVLRLSDTAIVEEDDIVGGYGVLQNEPRPQPVTLERLAQLMVTISDNTATNVLVDVVGYPAMQTLADALALQDMQFARKMFGTPNPPAVENYITAADTLVLLREIYAGDFLSEQSRQQILTWMSAQTVKTKIAAGVPPGTPIAHKTGENGAVSHDVGYILIPGHELALALFAQSLLTDDFDQAQAQLNPLLANITRSIIAVVNRELID